MIRSLRKGRTSVYFQHTNTGHSISAERYECEIKDDEIVIRFSLRPAGGNESFDEEYTYTHAIEYVEIGDGKVIDELSSFVKHHTQEFSAFRLEVLSRRGKLSFTVTPQRSPVGNLRFASEIAVSSK